MRRILALLTERRPDHRAVFSEFCKGVGARAPPARAVRAGEGDAAVNMSTTMKTETKFAHATLSAVEADGTFSGYASLFGKADLGRDMVMPGAFRASLAKRGAAGVKMLFQHDPNEPIGVWIEIREDASGLLRQGQAHHRGRAGARS